MENTTPLVKSGIFQLYTSSSLLLPSSAGHRNNVQGSGYFQIIFGVINIAALFLTARIEEKEMTAKFGGQYTDYMKETKMFFPFIL